MEKLKEHLDKIAGVLIILACLGWVVSRHLAENRDGLSAQELQKDIDKVRNANFGITAEEKAVGKYAASFAENMRRVEPDVSPAGLTAWAFHAAPGVFVAPVDVWVVGIRRFGTAAGDEAAAYALAEEVRLKGIEVRVEKVRDADSNADVWWVASGRFTAANDPQVHVLRQSLDKTGYKDSVVKLAGQDARVGVQPVLAGVVGSPQMAVRGVYIGKAQLAASFDRNDKNWARRWLLVWRRRAGEDKWPADPLVVVKVEGDRDLRISVTPAGAAAASAGGLEISETALQAREVYEYRALAAAAFVRDAVVDPGLRRMTDLDRVLGEQTYAAAEFSGVVKVEVPGDVQIQFQSANRGPDGKPVDAVFNFKRFIADSEPVRTIKAIRIGERIKTQEPKRINNKQVQVDFDSEARLVSVIVEQRNVSGAPTDVEVAVIEDTRTGKQHKVDKPRIGGENWWPKTVAVHAPPAEVKPADPRAPVGERRGPATEAQPAVPKTVTPKPSAETPKPSSEPKTPVLLEKPPAESVAAPPAVPGGGEVAPALEIGPDGKPKEPGQAPDVTPGNVEQEKKYAAWKAARDAYDEWVSTQAGSSQK